MEGGRALRIVPTLGRDTGLPGGPILSGGRGKAGGVDDLNAFSTLLEAVYESATDPDQWRVFLEGLARTLNHEILMTLYGLTNAEARLACALSQGYELGQLSKRWRTSRETLRTHLKRVLGKTGTSRQADLVRLLTGTPWNLTGGPSPLIQNAGDTEVPAH